MQADRWMNSARYSMRIQTPGNNFILTIPLLFAVGSGIAVLAILVLFLGRGTQKFGGNTEIIRLSDGSSRLRLFHCNLVKGKLEFAELLMVENVSEIELRNSILDEDTFFNFHQEGSLKKLGLSGCVLPAGCVTLICDLSQLDKLTLIDCGLDRASLAEIATCLSGCDVVPKVPHASQESSNDS